MARSKGRSLVSEIARLLVEYPEKDWSALVDRLRDRAFMDDLVTAITSAREIATKSSAKAKKSRSGGGRNILAEVAGDDKEKAEILSEIKSRLVDQGQIVTLADLRAFASSLGMKGDLANRRNQAINQIIRYLAGKTTDQIEAALHTALPDQARQGQEFDRWVDLILGSRSPLEGEKRTLQPPDGELP